MLVHHEMRKGSYNEVIVDPSPGVDHTEAFYFVKHKPKKLDAKELANGKKKVEDPDYEGFARGVHRQFHERYASLGRAVPLVQLELEPEDGRPPFVRVA